MLKLLTAFGLLFVLTGCSLDSTLTGLNPLEAITLSTKSSSAEVVSGSVQYDTTTNPAYKISVSVGSPYSVVKGADTVNGYKVYSTVQGQMISEDIH